MTAYLFALILALGIPFLLYCLWNFSGCRGSFHG